MSCPLCGARKARRACPALNQEICPICCGTKRQIEIRCPADCPYLATSREHPAGIVKKQQERDLALLVHLMRDFNDRQGQLLLDITTFLARYRPSGLENVVDADVADAAAALAATFETASKGLIYDDRPASLPAERLAVRLKAVVAAPQEGSTAFERDAAGVLRRIEAAVRDLGAREANSKRPFLDLLERVTRDRRAEPTAAGAVEAAGPRLIVP